MAVRTVERTEPTPVATVVVVVLVVQRCTTATTPTVVIPIWAMVVSGTWQWVPVTVITPTVTHNTPTAILTCKEVTVLELTA
uniref:Putative secreted peptide n=1 Tax=Anopheles braziliensis TaxID=58242 RepID=A0A2M3ZWL0_9DIPT